jgi:hypothetical protein
VQVLQSIPGCPSEPQLQFTACTLVRKFACWLARSGLEQPSVLDLVPPLFRVVLGGLCDVVSAGGASLAFAALCTECGPTVLAHCRADVLAVLEAAAKTETWQQAAPPRAAAAGAGRAAAAARGAVALEEEDVCSIVEGTAEVLGYAVRIGDTEVRWASAALTEAYYTPARPPPSSMVAPSCLSVRC